MVCLFLMKYLPLVIFFVFFFEWIMAKELLKIYCPNEYTEPKPSRQPRTAPIYKAEPKVTVFDPYYMLLGGGGVRTSPKRLLRA